MPELQSFFINWYERKPERYCWKEVLGYSVDLDLDIDVVDFEMKAGKLQEVFDKEINRLRDCGLLGDHNNKIGGKVMIEKGSFDE